MKTFLFQGDSITDCDRNRNDDKNFGLGYPNMVAGRLMKDFPGEFFCVNKGVSGDRSVSLLARMKRDLLYYKPDIMTLLIGVNDVWHDLDEKPNGVCADDYEEYLTIFFTKILKNLPNIQIYVLEPFCLPGTATAGTPENWEYFSTEVPKVAERAKKVAEKFGFTFIPLQEKFDEACKTAPADYWLRDGVHPTTPGHQLIADEILKLV